MSNVRITVELTVESPEGEEHAKFMVKNVLQGMILSDDTMGEEDAQIKKVKVLKH